MSDEPYTICPVCRQPITEDEPGVIRACEVVRTSSFQVGDEAHEGIGALFHADCWPLAGPGYRRKV